MPNYNDAQGVADLLSQFDFNIISEGPGDFSTQHRKYTCEFSKPGIESFTTTYQCNPRFGGQPTATDVFAALASDALAVDGRHIDDFAAEAETAIQDAMDSPLYDALGSNDEILEDGELSGDFEAIKESGYDFPNPCAMSVEAVRTVNEKGYEAAFNEFWKDLMPEDHELAAVQDVTLIPVTLHFNETPDKSENMTFSAQDTNGLDIDGEVFFCGLTHEELTGMVGKQTGEDFTVESVGEPYQVEAHPKSQEPSQPRLAEKAKETRDGSDKLEQDSHDGQTPEREVERADGDAEH